MEERESQNKKKTTVISHSIDHTRCQESICFLHPSRTAPVLELLVESLVNKPQGNKNWVGEQLFFTKTQQERSSAVESVELQ